MQAIIVAGGRGERLRPLTDTLPKPMLPVAGKPILEHTVQLLRSNGVINLILALGYLPEPIVKHFGDGEKFGVSIKYTFENPKKPLQTAGAIRQSIRYIEDDLIVTYADILRKLDIADMITLHRKTNAFATLNVYKEYDQVPISLVNFTNDGQILEFIERPDTRNANGSFVWTNGSFYIFRPEIFDFVGKEGPKDFAKDVFPELLRHKKLLVAYPSSGYFLDIGTKEKLALAQKTFPGAA